MLRVLFVDSWPDTQPGQFYGSFRLLGLIRMRQVVLSLWLRLWHPALIFATIHNQAWCVGSGAQADIPGLLI